MKQRGWDEVMKVQWACLVTQWGNSPRMASSWPDMSEETLWMHSSANPTSLTARSGSQGDYNTLLGKCRALGRSLAAVHK